MPDRRRFAVRSAVVSAASLLALVTVSRANAQTGGGDAGVTVPVAPAPQASATVNPAFLQQQPSGFPFSTSSIALIAIIAIVVVAAILNVRGKARP